MKNPFASVKETHGDKAKLVAALQKLAGDDLWIDRTNKKKGLGHVANAKLLRLHATFTAVKQKFGTRDKLIAAILDIEKRAKDDGEKSRLGKFPVPRLWDMYRSLEKRDVRSKKEKAPSKPKTASAKKAPEKAPKKADAKKKTS
jgi:hypothetical protein